MVPKLKPAGWERVGDATRIVLDPRQSIELADPDGAVLRLLELLAEAGRTIPQLLDALQHTHPECAESDVATAIEVLDGLRLVEDERSACGLRPAERQRHLSNLAFFSGRVAESRASR